MHDTESRIIFGSKKYDADLRIQTKTYRTTYRNENTVYMCWWIYTMQLYPAAAPQEALIDHKKPASWTFILMGK